MRITLQPVALGRLVIFKGFQAGSRYERFRRLEVLSGDSARLAFQGFSLAGGGVKQAFLGSEYELLVDGKKVATTKVTAGMQEAAFEFGLSDIAPGWHQLGIEGLAGGETCPAWWVYVKRGMVNEPAFIPVVRGTYELAKRADGVHAWAQAPARYNPLAKPLVPRGYPAFDAAVPRSDLHCSQLVPVRNGDVHRPNIDPSGIVSSFDSQSYFWSDFIAAKPRVPVLDGPRGVGTLCMTTHAAVGNGPRGNVFVCDPWRVARVAADGTITTLVGYRHKGLPTHWENEPVVELVGDWSGVPPERRGFHELWGMAWDERTVVINEAAAPLPHENNEKPHAVGPVMFVADSQRNRVCRVEFSPVAHNVPPRVTEFITGIADPWDVVCQGGVLYVSERQSHRIAAYDATTGAYLRTLVQGPAMSSIDRYRKIVRGASMAILQAQSCVGPEGLYLLDDWLYFGSAAQGQVRRLHVTTGVLELVCAVPMDNNSQFVKLAVSDGTFGPKGTVFTTTWSAKEGGLPAATLPNGTRWKWSTGSVGSGAWSDFGYASAVAVSQGRLVCGGVTEGLLAISRRQAGDQMASAEVTRGAEAYAARALHLLHGDNGFGFYGLQLPWGVSSDIDAFLTFHGHSPH